MGISNEELRGILDAHELWLTSNRVKGARADLSYTNIISADLRGRNMRSAILSYAILDSADLRGANLASADMKRASLRQANLQDANLSYADLDGASLNRANLRYARLVYAILGRAGLVYADLTGANLENAIIEGAAMDGATMTEVTLPGGETWEKYLSEVVPQLLACGEFGTEAAMKSWGNHTWDNCPIHAAFGVHGTEGVPALLRPRVLEFVHYYDNGLIPLYSLPKSLQLKAKEAK